MTLTFDLHDIQLQVMNAQKLKHVHTKFGQVAIDSLIFFAQEATYTKKSVSKQTEKHTKKK